MGDTIRWCFGHNELPSSSHLCDFAGHGEGCDVADALVIRADTPVYRMVASLSQQAYPNEGEVLVHAIMQRIGAETKAKPKPQCLCESLGQELCPTHGAEWDKAHPPEWMREGKT